MDLKGHRTIGLADSLVRMRIPDLLGTARVLGSRPDDGHRVASEIMAAAQRI